jgi:hypothetical protein
MARLGKVLRGVAIAAASWLLILFIAGFAARGCVRNSVQERLSTTLGGRADVGKVSLGLIAGHVELRDVDVVRDTGGDLKLHVSQVQFSMAPLGLGLFSRHVRRMEIRGVTLDMSGRAALHVHPRPIETDDFELHDAKLTLVPSNWAPGPNTERASERWLAGVVKIEVTVNHAQAGPVVLATSLSWIFKLKAFDASIDVAGVAVSLRFRDGKFYAAGSVFGSAPVELPFGLNAVAAGEEVQALMEFGKKLGKEVLLRKAKDLLAPLTAPTPPPTAP